MTIPQRRGEPVVVDSDEHPRATSLEALARLKPINPGGTVTAGTASGVNDGAAAVLIASERAVARLQPDSAGQGHLGRGGRGAAPDHGHRPGAGNAEAAVPQRVDRRASSIVVELNEAFAAQALGVLRQLGLADDAEHVNPNGGAIALGHPLGASGARIALTAAIELHDRGARRALATMCIGVGQGISVLLESA